MAWFKQVAPIRLKLLVAFGGTTFLVALAALTSLVMGLAGHAVMGAIAGFAFTLVAGGAGAWIRKAVCDPYVTTVVRMEALAAAISTHRSRLPSIRIASAA